MKETLEGLRVKQDALSPAQRKALDETGFILVPRVLLPVKIEALRRRFEELMTSEGDKAGLEVHQQPGTRRLADLVNKGDVFDGIWTNPKVLAAVDHILKRPFKLSSLNARDALPGRGEQGLHADWGPRDPSQPFHAVNSIWMLDDFTEENGSVRVVPGSHLRPGGPPALKDELEPHPEEQRITGLAGSLVIYNAHLWHSGTRNRGRGPRRALHVFYCAAEHAPQTDQVRFARPETLKRLSPAARSLLGVPPAR